MSFSKLIGIFLCFWIVSCVVHYQGFDQPMIYDSKAWIGDKAHIFVSHNIMDVISIVPVRPVFMLSLYGNYLLAGMDPTIFRLINAGISAAAGLALVILLRTILGLPQSAVPGTEFQRNAVSLFLGLLFVIHPLQAYVVLYIWQREAILACFFYFTSLGAYITAASGRGKPLPYYILSGLLFFVGLLNKENLITLPIIMFLAEITLFNKTVREAIGKTLVIGGITVPALIAYLALTHMFHGAESVHAQGIVGRLSEHYAQGQITPLQVAMTECRIFFTYLTTVIIPFAVDLTLVKAVTISRSLVEPPSTFPAVAGVVGWIAASLWMLRRSPLVSFGGLFFLVVMVPESTLIPQFLFFGYRPILPMAGLLLILGQVVARTISWSEVRLPGSLFHAATALGVMAFVVALGWTSMTQAAKWSPLHFWENAYSCSPKYFDTVEKKMYTDILVNYGAELVNSGNYSEAVPLLREAIKLAPYSVGARNNLANAMLGQGRIQEAIEIYRDAIKQGFESPEVYNNLGAALLNNNKIEEARESFAKAVEIHPGFAKARANLGIVCLRLGLISEAVDNLRSAVTINPRLALAQSKLGYALELQRNYSEAAEHYKKALNLSPFLVEAHFGLANALANLDKIPEAIEHYKRVIQLNPKHYMAHNNLGSALLRMSEFPLAADHFRKALEIRPDFRDAEKNLEMVSGKSQKPHSQDR